VSGALTKLERIVVFLGAVKLLPFASSRNIVTTFSKQLIILLPPSAAVSRHKITLSFMIMRMTMMMDKPRENNRILAVQHRLFSLFVSSWACRGATSNC
jgi:hypothetical protein